DHHRHGPDHRFHGDHDRDDHDRYHDGRGRGGHGHRRLHPPHQRHVLCEPEHHPEDDGQNDTVDDKGSDHNGFDHCGNAAFYGEAVDGSSPDTDTDAGTTFQ
ncbi:MAG: hypothetical protein IKX83_04355, partial [Clostridia bacterium]|nr:hypothetical protein [Clostridia bacterium]